MPQMTSKDLHWRKAHLQLPSYHVLMVKDFEEACSGAGASVHAVQLCLVLNCTRPRNFPHVNERLARDPSRVPNFHAATVRDSSAAWQGCAPSVHEGTGDPAFLQRSMLGRWTQSQHQSVTVATSSNRPEPSEYLACWTRRCRVLSNCFGNESCV